MLEQERNVLHSLAKRGDKNRHHIQPIKQIFPKLFGSHQAFEILIRGRNNAGIRFIGSGATHPFKGSLLQDSKQFHLQGGTQITNFIEKNGPSGRQLKSSHTGRHRSGKRPLLMTE